MYGDKCVIKSGSYFFAFIFFFLKKKKNNNKVQCKKKKKLKSPITSDNESHGVNVPKTEEKCVAM